jgi:excisionase family DNA binding protein
MRAADPDDHEVSLLLRLDGDTSAMSWPEPLTVQEVSVELRCSVDEVRALIREGELQTVSCGIRPSLVPRHQLDDYLRRHRQRIDDRADA